MKPYQVNQYLAANGVTVSGNTDDYYRLSPDGIKAWYVDGVAEPTEADLAGYPDVDPVDVALTEIARLEATITPRRTREAMLGNAEAIAFIQGVEDLIAIERAKL
jgi:hypothetical protein